MIPLTALEKFVILLSAGYVSAVLYDNVFTYLISALLLNEGLQLTVLWLKNWFGGDS